jgi:hypothetical protein
VNRLKDGLVQTREVHALLEQFPAGADGQPAPEPHLRETTVGTVDAALGTISPPGGLSNGSI